MTRIDAYCYNLGIAISEKGSVLISLIAISCWGGRRKLPFVFTELGVAMLSSVLNSERAVQMNIFIMRAFIKLREILSTEKDLAKRMAELEKEQLAQGKDILTISKVINRLVSDASKPRSAIGFQV